MKAAEQAVADSNKVYELVSPIVASVQAATELSKKR
jgi:hypothetical protein